MKKKETHLTKLQNEVVTNEHGAFPPDRALRAKPSRASINEGKKGIKTMRQTRNSATMELIQNLNIVLLCSPPSTR